MSLIDGRAWILQLLKVGDDLIQRDTLKIGHVVTSRAPLS
jgi:hypothetical protein